ncbi:hypothetical protein [Pseudoalteromonas viridis]|uniref:Uncharacterized protein n=1 Tax=Pseudoalteromonas viridis TaxID=339617 RepID=A0ABX7V4K0_9GAMM|nr:hypothetical protein [Pseudoalteromonas viridis]QTL34160.1 hypothetical protein J5X90_11305 [Pseudoalteromonas viridis]
MYWIKRLLQALLLIVLLLAGYRVALHVYVWLNSAERIAARSEEETRSVVHWLSPDRPLIYTFPTSRTVAIRVLSNAIFASQTVFDRPINYAIEYRLLDSQDNELEKHVYHHASKLALEEGQQQVKQLIEDRQALAVTSGQSFYVDWQQLTRASKISLRLIPEEPSLRGVVVRIHGKTPTNADDVTRTWLKLPEQWRERMTSYHTLGSSGLQPQQVANAVSYDWRKLAPQGIPGIDFDADILYESLPYNVITYDFSAEQFDLDGYYTRAGLSASIRLTNTGSLSVQTQGDVSDLQLIWHDLTQRQAPQTLNLTETDDPTRFLLPELQPGLLAIHSQTEMITTWRDQQDQIIAPLHSYYYQLDEASQVAYTVQGGSDIQLDMRGPAGSTMQLNIYDNQLQRLRTETLTLSGQSGGFDRLITPETRREAITDSEKRFLRLSPQAHRITLSSTSAVAVKLQSRHSAMHHQNYVCATLCDAPQTGFTEVGAWFSQSADNEFDFIEQQKILKVRLFSAPPPLEEKQTGYLSQALFVRLPVSNTALVYSPPKYFAPPEPPAPFQYAPLTSLTTLHSAQRSIQELGSLTAPIPRVITLSDNGIRYTEQDITQLDPLPNLSDPSSRHFINLGKPRDYWKVRLFQLQPGQTLKQDYRGKDKPMAIVIKPFTRGTHSADPLLIQTKLDGRFSHSITDEYSIARKRYALAPEHGLPAFLLHPKNPALTAYPSVTLTIGSDIDALNELSVSAEQTLWFALLEEYATPPPQPQWWQHEY